MSDVADKLREARALIERGWVQRTWALDARGDTVLWDNPGVVCICARGALWRVSNDGAVELAFEQAIGTDIISEWNDAPDRTQAEVLAAFDRAIELAETES